MATSAIKTYYELAKPRMVYGNAVPIVAGFVLGSKGDVRPWPFVATLVGMSFVMASACVFNNVIDSDMDAKMRRTMDRAVASGRVSKRAALVYGTVLGLAGAAVLALHVNLVTVAVGAFGFFFYVVMYSMWWKRRSPLGTAVGSVAGAVPPVAGYVAATGRIDLAAGLLFALMVAWQMPHFFAIAIRVADEYAAAKVPVLPLVRGLRATKVQMFLYIAAFTAIAPLLTVFGYCDYVYFSVAVFLGFAWLALALKGFRIPDGDKENVAWARQMFVFSLVVMVTLFVTMTLTALA